jgi:HSP20 family protein
MSTKALAKRTERSPFLFDDFFKPWNEWFDGGSWGRTMSVPAVNITENEKGYEVSLAVPGMKKSDFDISLDGNMLTISSEKEESREEKDVKFTRNEYNFSSFSRSFTLPEEINKEKIEASYVDGVLKIVLPSQGEMKKFTHKQIDVK